MATIKVTPFNGGLENAELNYSCLYLQQVIFGATANQAKIVSKDPNTGLGETYVNNWPIYDDEANLVARAQGLHMYAGSWYNSFVIVFEIARFKGSTLQVSGASIGTTGDWAITGGTGEFELARGIIKREDQGGKQQLTISAFYRGRNVPTLKRLGPWGGQADDGVPRDVLVKPWRLESITVRVDDNVDSIAFTYLDKDGHRHDSGQWGLAPAGSTLPPIILAPTEVVTEVSGTYIPQSLSSIKFVTNLHTYGPYGQALGTSFKAPLQKDDIVVGFFAVSGKYLDKIGVYTI